MVRMRLIKDAYLYLKEKDPDTAITLSYFKKLIKQGVIPVIKVGAKCLVNLDTIEEFFKTGEFLNVEETKPKIRPVSENIRFIK